MAPSAGYALPLIRCMTMANDHQSQFTVPDEFYNISEENVRRSVLILNVSN